MQKKTCLQKRLQGVESKICVQKRKVDLWLWLWPRESPVTAGFKLQNRFFVTKREYWHLPKYPQFCSWRLTLHGNRLNCTKIIHFFSRFTFCPLLPTHCRWRGLLLHLSTLHDTHTHTLGTTPLGEWSARRSGRYLHNTQHSQNIYLPRRNSNPQSSKESGQTSRP